MVVVHRCLAGGRGRRAAERLPLGPGGKRTSLTLKMYPGPAAFERRVQMIQGGERCLKVLLQTVEVTSVSLRRNVGRNLP